MTAGVAVLAGPERVTPGGSVEDDRVVAPRPDEAGVAGEQLRCAAGNDGCVAWIAEVDEVDDPGGLPDGGTLVTDDVVVAAVEGGVIVRDVTTGVERWRAEIPGVSSRQVAMVPFEDRLLHLDPAGRLVARTTGEGEAAWVTDPLPIEASRVRGLEAVRDGDGLLLAARFGGPSDGPSGRGVLLALDGSTGAWRWHQHGARVALPLPPPPGPPRGAVAGDGPGSPEVIAVVQRAGGLRGLDRDGDTVWEIDDHPAADLALLGPVVHVLDPGGDGLDPGGDRPQARLRDTGELVAEDAGVYQWDEETDQALLGSLEGPLLLVVGDTVRWEVEPATSPLCGAVLEDGSVRLIGCDGTDRVLTTDGDELDPADVPEPETPASGPWPGPAVTERTEGDETTIVLLGDDGTATDVAHLPGAIQVLRSPGSAAGTPDTVLVRGVDYLVALRVPASPSP